MTEIEQRSVCSGVNFRSIRNTRFKTIRMSINFMFPLERESAASNAILPFLLSRASREYPDFTKLSERLEELYGASLDADVQKLGDVQLLSISATGIADRYAFGGEHVSTELSHLLCSIVFDPPFQDGLFPQDGFEQERRQTIELIESEYNDKRTYARLRCEELMCASEPYGIGRYGTKEQIQNLDRKDLTRVWQNLIRHAKAEIIVLGDCNPGPVYDDFCAAFRKADRGEPVSCGTHNIKEAKKVREVTDRLDVAQSKLVLGLRTACSIPDEQVPAVKLMTAVFGGTPNSKLFLNVREKLSLCYYCSALFVSMKGIMLVQSGVETRNIEKAKEEILFQLEETKRGNFSDNDMNAAKLSICNSYRTVSDSLNGLEAWYLSQTFAGHVQSPEEAAAEISAVTRKEITEAASRVSLDTVYRLVGKGEEAK